MFVIFGSVRIKKQKFKDVLANCSCDKDCNYTCIVWNKINIFGVPATMPENKLNAIYAGDYINVIKIGSILGCLILCKQIIAKGEDPHEVCDDIDGDLEYTLSALTDVGGIGGALGGDALGRYIVDITCTED